jgi:valyl-tRNA synthetase
MLLAKHYRSSEAEPRLQAIWQSEGLYHFSPDGAEPVYSIDTPPATVSGHLHLGHVYSYSHADFMARYFRMKGYNVFYPMGYDDNGLPTERLVERRLGITAAQVGRSAFIQRCLEISLDEEKDYKALWQRLGLSIDWRYSYRTIDELSRRTSQFSFINLYRKGLTYRQEAPAIWCPECRTSIAQAELNDLDRQSEFVTLPFRVMDDSAAEFLPVATTRPELLPACVAVFVHPQDGRYQSYVGHTVEVPLFSQHVPVFQDVRVDPDKGSGAVMCCTFGDTTDVAWWYTHKLPLMEAIDREGKMTRIAALYYGLTLEQARKKIKEDLAEKELLLNRQPVLQSIRVHERCDTPVEYIVTSQWFIRVLEHREALLEAGERLAWHPSHMKARYKAWVENLNWDWCISRQRYFGVPFPVWYCRACGDIMLADEDELPVDPMDQTPRRPCPCGSTEFIPEEDVLDTWATSSLSPQIVGRWLEAPEFYRKVFPFSLRPQAHEIIRTWAFYTIAKSQYHFERIPWKDVLISGWGLAGEGMGKISKSRGGGSMAPLEMIERYSADAVRYWAASSAPGKDSIINEEKIQAGSRLAIKLWNVARFSERFLEDFKPVKQLPELSPADRWLLSRLQSLIEQASVLFENFDYSAAKNEIENFFWSELADNYLEMCKLRLYDPSNLLYEGARFTLYQVLSTLVKLFAPFLPFVSDEIYRALFAAREGCDSVHASAWPEVAPDWRDAQAELLGELLVQIATCVRRYKSENNLSLGAVLNGLHLKAMKPEQVRSLQAAQVDIQGITRARQIEIAVNLPRTLPEEGWLMIGRAGEIEARILIPNVKP